MDLIEEWKIIPNSRDRYWISNLGNIKGTRGIVKPKYNQKGYAYTMLYERETHRYHVCIIHTMVAGLFIGPKPAGKEVNHKDTVKANNVYTNLEYVTHQENMHHASVHKLFRPLRGELNPGAKVSDVERAELVKLYIDDVFNQRELAEMYGLSRSGIRKSLAQAGGLKGILPPYARTHCSNGHEFTDSNTYRYNNSRHCRTCHRDTERLRRINGHY